MTSIRTRALHGLLAAAALVLLAACPGKSGEPPQTTTPTSAPDQPLAAPEAPSEEDEEPAPVPITDDNADLELEKLEKELDQELRELE